MKEVRRIFASAVALLMAVPLNAVPVSAEESSSLSAADYNYRTILGDASEYGILADTYDQTQSHTETNFAVKNFKGGQQDLEVDLSNSDAEIPFITANIDGRLRFGQKADDNDQVIVYMQEAQSGQVVSDGSNNTRKINRIFKLQADLNTMVQSYQNAISSMSDAMNYLPQTEGVKIDPNQKLIDTTALPDNTAVVINLDDGSYFDMFNGCPTIKKHTNQNIIFNVRNTRYTTLREYTVTDADTNESVKTNSQTNSGTDSADNNQIDRLILRHIIWNVRNGVSNMTIQDTAGLYILPEADNISVRNSAGWTVSTKPGAVVKSEGEWHFIYHGRTYHYTCNAVLEASKQLEGADLKAGQFSFELKDSKGNVLQTKKNDADGNITFDAIQYGDADADRTYTYTINEVKGDDQNIEYDDHAETVTVKITRNENDTLKSDTVYANGTKPVFKNTYKAPEPVKAVIEASKQLEGADLQEGQFSFELKDSEGTVLQTKTNDGNGNITFDAIEYTAEDVGKKYTYTISEVKGDDKNIKYDDHTETVTVEVVKNNDNSLTAPIHYQNESVPVFKNTYNTPPTPVHLSTEAVFEASKKLENADLQEGQFSFELKDSEGTVLQTKKNDADGNITFNPMKYTSEDAGKTFTYTISEVNDKQENIKYDSHVESVIVEIEKSDDNSLKAVTSYDADGAAFLNTYEKKEQPKPTDAVLKASKKLDGADLKEGQFSFELKDSEGTVLQTKTNDGNGNITFDAIEYTAEDVGKKYTYTISEVKGDDKNIKYDDHTETVTVEVVKNNDNSLTPPIHYQNESVPVFKNTYNTPPTPVHLSTDAVFEAYKKLENADLQEGQFSFELKDSEGTVLQTKKNDAKGNITFDAIAYTEADAGKTFTYTISEVDDGQTGVKYDTHTETVKVTVTKNDDSLKAVTTYDVDGASFLNTYEKKEQPKPTDAVFKASKQLEGADLQEGQFSFELKDSEGTVLQTKKNDGNGNITFNPMKYTAEDAGKTFTYTISEVNDGQENITYDDQVETVTVHVVKNDDNSLTAKIDYQSGDVPVFKNTYDTPPTPTPIHLSTEAVLEAYKKLENADLQEGQFSFELKDSEGTVLQTKKNDAKGNITFDAIAYTEADAGKTFTYTISEVNDGQKNILYDEHTETVTVEVVQNDDTLTASVTYEDGQKPLFVNSMKPEIPHTPDQPDQPDTPEKPDRPRLPRTPGKPRLPRTPGRPRLPRTPATGDTTNVRGYAAALLISGAAAVVLFLRKRRHA